MKKLIISNLKMNLTTSQCKEYFIEMSARLSNEKTEVVICPSFPSLSMANFLTEKSPIKIGGQNLCEAEEGSWTGEVSANMLKDCGCEYVIVGHCERRMKFKESSSQINKKIKNALKQGIKCILCIGENSLEKKTGKTEIILQKQIEEGLKGLYENELESIILAYEPIWSVGTGIIPTFKEIEDVSLFARGVISQNYSQNAGKNLQFVYGGSVDGGNISKIVKTKGIDGVLIGKASNDADNFLSLINKIR